jgi:hypothetical protein
MPVSPADIDVFEIRKLQQYIWGCNSSFVQSDRRRIGLLLIYNRYYYKRQSSKIRRSLGGIYWG